MNRKITAIILALLMIGLFGCSATSSAKTSTIYVDKNGKVSSVTIENLSAEQYSEEELRELVTQTIKEYNSEKGEDKVKLDELKVKKEQARLAIEYATSADYEEFNGRILFVGTVAEAKEAGYDFETDFVGADEATIKGEAVVGQEKDSQVIITNEPVQIKTIKDILYTSTNAKITDKRAAQVDAEAGATENGITFGNSECAYIIYRMKAT